MKTKLWYLITVIVILSMTAGMAMAEDGAKFLRNISATPDQETERANLNHMAFYVPMQNANGRVLVEGTDTATMYYSDYPGVADDKTLEFTRGYAKPLVTVYIDSMAEDHETLAAVDPASGMTIGAHDAFASFSLDDGSTWKSTNLSKSAALSSFTLSAEGQEGIPYPGDAHNMTFAIAGDKVLVGWISKYCNEGNPFYRFSAEDIVALQTAYGLPDLYVHDIWGVNGHQGSVDYAEEGFPEVGEIPYSCVWAARGQLLPVTLSPVSDPHPGYDIVWLEAERLTSGVRDANRLEMASDSAAGFMMTWQEDPDGLRPGLGLGPGEGWSGAVVHQDTDLWYSFISIDHFDLVVDSGADATLTTGIPLAEYVAAVETYTTKPELAVPMAIPIRLSDNAKCLHNGNSPAYCYINFDDVNPWLTELGDTLGVLPEFTPAVESTFCTSKVTWTTPGDAVIDLCEAEDDRVMLGRVGASRPRVNVQPYNSLFVADDTDDTTWYDSGIVIMGAEESKALGSLEETLDVIEIGKNMMYYSFDLLNPSFVQQGGQLNWPAKDPLSTTGEVLPILTDDFGDVFYDTEIARRFSHMSQPIHQFGESGISSVLIVKQGIINQGGPADIFIRTTQVDTDMLFDCELDGDTTTMEQCLPEGYNPYAYQNLVCDNWEFTDGTNPRYLEGYCTSTGINISGVKVATCDGDCTTFPWDGGVEFPKVLSWDQTVAELDDESWVMPWDVSKGHRGFIDGDFIMMMYAWSPNWKANSVGNDHYNLYARRSFDGGATWTTTPALLGGDGTETCENFNDGDPVCTTYGAGDFEKARNLSQLTGQKETILDPRYTPTGGLKMLPIKDKYALNSEVLPYDDDAVRDPSKFFIVYETGDNTTVEVGEAVPMDLFYSRATNWGDDYDLREFYDDANNLVRTEFWPLENDPEFLSGEAANTCNPAGTFYYAIWNQWQEDAEENVSNSDAFFSRSMWLTDVVADRLPIVTFLYTGPIMYSISADDTLTMAVSAKDWDNLGDGEDITEVEWIAYAIDPVTSELVERDLREYCTGSTCNVPMRTLSTGWAAWGLSGNDYVGWASMGIRAKDNEGNYSKQIYKEILIATAIHTIHLPLTIK